MLGDCKEVNEVIIVNGIFQQVLPRTVESLVISLEVFERHLLPANLADECFVQVSVKRNPLENGLPHDFAKKSE